MCYPYLRPRAPHLSSLLDVLSISSIFSLELEGYPSVVAVFLQQKKAEAGKAWFSWR